MNMKKGFTLIEIMIVVAIIAILAAVAIPNFIKYRQTAQANSCKATMNTIMTAAEAWLIANPGEPLSMDKLWNTQGTGFLKVTAAPTCPTDGQALTVSEQTVTVGEGDAAVTAKKVVVTCPTHGDVK